MKPGRELDALIAEKVMGWKWHPIKGDEPYYDELTKNHGGFWLNGTASVNCTDINGAPNCPHYSTDIAAAWEVAQKLADMNEDNELVIYVSPSKHNECEVSIQFWDRSNPDEPVLSGPFYLCGESAPHAICLAALKALGVAV